MNRPGTTWVVPGLQDGGVRVIGISADAAAPGQGRSAQASEIPTTVSDAGHVRSAVSRSVWDEVSGASVDDE